jgi:predicted RNA methylase
MSVIEEPKLAPNFLRWIETENVNDKTMMEFGSGYSSLFFSKHFKKVFSFEHDPVWINKLNELKINNNIEFYKLDNNILNENFVIDLIKKADYFLIDSHYKSVSRYYLSLLIDNYKKDDSIIVLDNCEWVSDAYEFLRKKYYCIDFPYEREDGTKTETSVFFKKRNTIFSKNVI